MTAISKDNFELLTDLETINGKSEFVKETVASVELIWKNVVNAHESNDDSATYTIIELNKQRFSTLLDLIVDLTCDSSNKTQSIIEELYKHERISKQQTIPPFTTKEVATNESE